MLMLVPPGKRAYKDIRNAAFRRRGGTSMSQDLQQVSQRLSAALGKLEVSVSGDDRSERLKLMEQEIADLRAQCAMLIKENSTLNAAIEEANATRQDIEARHRSLSNQLDNAINQLEDVLQTEQ
jgi:chromosome segregation ATPase